MVSCPGMLSFAACHGRDDIVRHLLRAGAEAVYVNLDEELDRDAAKNKRQLVFTYETYTRYMKALEDRGMVTIHRTKFDDECGDEIYWDADENLI